MQVQVVTAPARRGEGQECGPDGHHDVMTLRIPDGCLEAVIGNVVGGIREEGSPAVSGHRGQIAVVVLRRVGEAEAGHLHVAASPGPHPDERRIVPVFNGCVEATTLSDHPHQPVHQSRPSLASSLRAALAAGMRCASPTCRSWAGVRDSPVGLRAS